MQYCRDSLKVENHDEKEQHSNTINKFITSTYENKQPNNTIKITGIDCALLLEGKIQLRKLQTSKENC